LSRQVSKEAREGGSWLTWVFTTEVFSKVEQKFGRSAIEGHHTRPDGTGFKWKKIGANQSSGSHELPFFIQWLAAGHPSQEGKVISVIEKITITESDHLSI
jgi:hypothetical protein